MALARLVNKSQLLPFVACVGLLLSTQVLADANPPVAHPFYMGVQLGYGSTTWEGLVPSANKQNSAMAISTPISVEEGGTLWGLVAGYEAIPNFALEANYQRLPSATITFDKDSLFAFEHEDRLFFRSQTETTSLLAKIMLPLFKSNVRAFSSAGIAGVHRWDSLTNQWHMSPTFGLGFNMNVNERLMLELGGNYIAGYGESELNPSDNYIPFLYSVSLTVAFRF